MNKYEVILYWSDEDGVFVGEVPELPGCCAHGADQEMALANTQKAIELWLETAREFNDPIPAPKEAAVDAGLALSQQFKVTFAGDARCLEVVLNNKDRDH